MLKEILVLSLKLSNIILFIQKKKDNLQILRGQEEKVLTSSPGKDKIIKVIIQEV